MLQRKNGATLAEIMDTMAWQRHTVRGFMAGAMKKAGYTVESFKPEGGERTPNQQVTSNFSPLPGPPGTYPGGFIALIPNYYLAFEPPQSDQWSCPKTNTVTETWFIS
jgi:hypothetical protein